MPAYDVSLEMLSTTRGFREQLRQLSRRRNADSYHYTAQAVSQITRQAQKNMMGAVQGRPVSWSGGTIYVKRKSGALHGAILGSFRWPYEGNRLRGALVIRHRHYTWIRDGIKPFDMKPGLLRNATRLAKDGSRYRIIGFTPKRGAGKIFRAVSTKSRGWIFPGTEPQRLDLYTNEVTRPMAMRALKRAVRRDLGL